MSKSVITLAFDLGSSGGSIVPEGDSLTVDA